MYMYFIAIGEKRSPRFLKESEESRKLPAFVPTHDWSNQNAAVM